MALLLIVNRITIATMLPPYVDLGVAVILTILLVYFVDGPRASRTALISITGFSIFLLFWAYATSPLYSPGDDEYAYHLTAIWDLAEGWNPLATPHNNIWIDSYPNGYWALQSYIVATTGLILSGQSLLSGLMVTVTILSYGFFLEHCADHVSKFKRLTSLFLACLVIGNPIVLTQVMTHYTDAPLYLLGCGLVFFLMIDACSPNKLARWGVLSCIILLINTKTANLYYVPLIVIGGFLADLVANGGIRNCLPRAVRWIISRGLIYAFVYFVAIIVLGYKPYVTNLQDHLALLYPSVTEIMSYNIPNNVNGVSAPVGFFYGIFAETGRTLWPYPFDSQINLKFPGTFSIDEFKILRFDTRRGGFGPMFSLALLSSILAYALCRIASLSSGPYAMARKGDSLATLALALLLISMFFPESWWARYVPFTWLSAVLFAVASLFLAGHGKFLILTRVLQGLAMLSFLLCVAAGAGGALKQSLRVQIATHAVEAVKDSPVIEIYIEKDIRITRDFQSQQISDAANVWARVLRENGVHVRIVGTEIPFREKEYCEKLGWLEAHVLWCVPRVPNKQPN
ncbi:hypothetical protein J0X12_09420 [Sneathiella sp. CAU 1612]|uniref:Glycosyltransferase RgtA/B/C/D-like domain-containing protein n=1 Tax=Sneathiella sedimenti TaxID=2816034 RepID=A0ABS3F676_9PROT|nr:hypothetical protein [Sneathiella sedimenti]MBO0333833.1 hypothetical protein [Sneathiella sedimenti]